MTVAKIWRKIPEQYNLIGRKCMECSEVYFPPREICLKCGSMEFSEYAFSGQGKIVTFTIIRTKQDEEELNEKPCRKIPYALAIVQFDEGPMLTAEIVDCDFSEIKIGKEVEVVFRKLLEKGEKGVIQYGYKFRLRDD
jgi:uncharacterized OB-fold protein